MEKKLVFFKTLRVVLILVFVAATIYLVRTSIYYFKDKHLFENSNIINLKFVKSSSKSHNAPKELIIKNLTENSTDTLNLDKLVPDKAKQAEILDQSVNSQGVDLVVIEQDNGEVVIDNKKYTSYTKAEFEEVKAENKNKYVQAFLLTIAIMIVTFVGTAFANKAANKKTRNRKSKPKKKK